MEIKPSVAIKWDHLAWDVPNLVVAKSWELVSRKRVSLAPFLHFLLKLMSGRDRTLSYMNLQPEPGWPFLPPYEMATGSAG